MLDESASQNWAYCSKFSEDKGEVVAVYLDSNICRKTGLSTHIKYTYDDALVMGALMSYRHV